MLKLERFLTNIGVFKSSYVIGAVPAHEHDVALRPEAGDDVFLLFWSNSGKHLEKNDKNCKKKIYVREKYSGYLNTRHLKSRNI